VFRKNTKTIVYFLILVFAFLLLFIPQGSIDPLKFTVMNIASVPLRILAFPFVEMKKILFYHRTFDEYLKLRKEVNTLKARLVGLDEVLLENSRLEQLLQFKRDLIFSSVAANIVGGDPSNWNEAILIDKGRGSGLDIGMPVVNALGVVGKIAEIDTHKAKVILLSDSTFSVAALVKRSREVGLITGTLRGKCRMRYLSSNADVKKGDQIITSKLSSSFPEGLLIGEVIDVRASESSPTIDCIVEPAVSLSQIEEVLVIQK